MNHVLLDRQSDMADRYEFNENKISLLVYDPLFYLFVFESELLPQINLRKIGERVQFRFRLKFGPKLGRSSCFGVYIYMFTGLIYLPVKLDQAN